MELRHLLPVLLTTGLSTSASETVEQGFALLQKHAAGGLSRTCLSLQHLSSDAHR
jgi:hypothetical protein